MLPVYNLAHFILPNINLLKSYQLHRRVISLHHIYIFKTFQIEHNSYGALRLLQAMFFLFRFKAQKFLFKG